MLKDRTVDKFKDDIINLNDKLYIDVDVLVAAIDELALTEAILGNILLDKNNIIKKDKNGNLEISDIDIYDYLENKYNKVIIERKDKTITISINK